MAIDEGDVTNVHEHPTHNFQDRVQLAGEVVPFPVSQSVEIARRMNMQNYQDDAAQRLGTTREKVQGAMKQIYSAPIIKGPGAND